MSDAIPAPEQHAQHSELRWVAMALAVVSIPQAFHLSPWVTLLSALLCLWRLGHARYHWPLLGRYTRISLAVLAGLSVWLSYQTLNGPEAGTALLLMLAALKFMEAETPRDYFLLLLIAYFIAIANFLYSQSIVLALYMLPAVWLTSAALLEVSQPEASLGPRRALTYTARFMLPSLPIAAVLFVLFPRIPGPLWGPGFNSGSEPRGLANTMHPGSISHLVQSNEVAFRVNFAGALPPARQRYWRGPVFSHFDGRSWSRAASRVAYRTSRSQPAGPAVRYTVTLEPSQQRWLFALAVPTTLPPDARMLKDGTLVNHTPIHDLYRYTVVSHLGRRPAFKLADAERKRDLQLPSADPRARRLARRWRAQAASRRDVVQKALRLFHEQPFIYTLKPPLLGKNSIDAFLFKTRRGFCEHYAGAFTFLMRAAGIPARVVTGYQGGEINPIGGYLIVRQSDAHAWSEVWLPDHGWMRVDPTAAIAPERIATDVADALAADGHAAGLAGAFSPWLHDLRFSWDALDHGWNQWILGYGPALQKHVFTHIGLRYGHWSEVGIVLTLSLAALMAALSGYWLWRARPRYRDPVVRLYQRFCKRLARAGMHRAANEGPLDFARRVARVRPELGSEVDEITRRYVALRYEAAAGRQALSEFDRHVAHFRP